MGVFHAKHLLSAYSSHNVPTNCFTLPEVEFRKLIIWYFSTFDEIITMAVPFLRIGDFDFAELRVDFKTFIVRVTQMIPKDLFALPVANYLFLSLQKLLIMVEVLLILCLILINSQHLMVNTGHLLMLHGLDLAVASALFFDGLVVTCHFDLYVLYIIAEMLYLSLTLHQRVI